MTFLELCVRVREETGISDSGPVSVTAQTGILGLIVSWVRQADLDIQNLNPDWRFRWVRATGRTTVANREEYLPSDFNMNNASGVTARNIDRVIVNNIDIPIVPWDKFVTEVELALQDMPASDAPKAVTVTPAGRIKFHPTINSALPVTIDHYQTAVPLQNNIDTSVIPQAHHEAIVAKALTKYGLEENDQAAYNNASMLYDEYISRLIHEEMPVVTFGGSKF